MFKTSLTINYALAIMFSLVKGIWDHYTQKPSFNILIIGLDNAGKTVKERVLI